MATLGAVLLLTAGISAVRGMREGEEGFYNEYGTGSGFVPNDAVPDKAFDQAVHIANAEVSWGGVSSLLTLKTAALVIPVLSLLFASWTSFRGAGSSELAGLKDRARVADDLIYQTVYTLGVRLNATDHSSVQQTISDLAVKHQNCRRDDSQLNEMFAHLKQEVEAGWFSASDDERASMTNQVPELRLDVFQPVASGMEIWNMVHNLETCQLGQSKAQGEITNKTVSQTELRAQESACQRELADAKNVLSDVIDGNIRKKTSCEQTYHATAGRLRGEIAGLLKEDAVCAIELIDCRKKI